MAEVLKYHWTLYTTTASYIMAVLQTYAEIDHYCYDSTGGRLRRPRFRSRVANQGLVKPVHKKERRDFGPSWSAAPVTNNKPPVANLHPTLQQEIGTSSPPTTAAIIIIINIITYENHDLRSYQHLQAAARPPPPPCHARNAPNSDNRAPPSIGSCKALGSLTGNRFI